MPKVLTSFPALQVFGALRPFCTELRVQPCHSTQRDAVRMQLSSLWHTHLKSHTASIWLVYDGLSQAETVLRQGLSRFQLLQRFKVTSGPHQRISGAKSFSFSHGSCEVNCHDTSLWEASFPTLHCHTWHFHCHIESQYIVGKLSWKRQYLTSILSKQSSQSGNDRYPNVVTPNLSLTKTVLASKYRMFR